MSADDPIRVVVFRWSAEEEWIQHGSGFIQVAPARRESNAMEEEEEVVLDNNNNSNSERKPTPKTAATIYWMSVVSETEEKLFEKEIFKDTELIRDQQLILLWKQNEDVEYALGFHSLQDMEKFEGVFQDIVSSYPANLQYESMREESAQFQLLQRNSNPVFNQSIGSITLPGGEEISLAIPDPKPSNLAEIEKIFTSVTGAPPACKNYVAKQLTERDLLPVFFDLFENFEDLESTSDLHHVYKIFKCIVSLAVPAIFNFILGNALTFAKFVGVFEYDPEYPNVKPGFREYLGKPQLFKEVIPFEPDVTAKIHQIFRAQFLKDVVLARILEDDSFTILVMLIRSRQEELIKHILAAPNQQNSNRDIAESLLELFLNPGASLEDRKNILGFLKELASMVRMTEDSMVFVHKFKAFLEPLGNILLLDIGQDADSELLYECKVLAAEILTCFIDYNAVLVRECIVNSSSSGGIKKEQGVSSDVEEDNSSNLLRSLSLALSQEKCDDSGLLGSYQEMLKMLLNIPNPNSVIEDDHLVGFFDLFYKKYVKGLLEPFKRFNVNHKNDNDNDDEMQEDDISNNNNNNDIVRELRNIDQLSLCMELFIIFIKQHSYRVKYIILETPLFSHVISLLQLDNNTNSNDNDGGKRKKRNEFNFQSRKHLQLLAIKFVKTCLSLSDDFYVKYLVKNGILVNFVKLFELNGFKDNLINSALIDMFEVMLNLKSKTLLNDLMETHGRVIEDILDHKHHQVPILRKLVESYQQKESGGMEKSASGLEVLNSSSMDDIRGDVTKPGGDWTTKIDKREESYFSDSDFDADNDERKGTGKKKNKNVYGLVQYDDDEDEGEGENDDDNNAKSSEKDQSTSDVDTLPSVIKRESSSDDEDGEDEALSRIINRKKSPLSTSNERDGSLNHLSNNPSNNPSSNSSSNSSSLDISFSTTIKSTTPIKKIQLSPISISRLGSVNTSENYNSTSNSSSNNNNSSAASTAATAASASSLIIDEKTQSGKRIKL